MQYVVSAMRFPKRWTRVIASLFYRTEVSLSINGHLGKPFIQERGLRQGDPLSPFLFNLAIDPLMRMLDNPRLWPGITLSNRRAKTPPIRLSQMAYADDLLIFMDNPKRWSKFLELFNIYAKASNAKLNVSKTVMISMGGEPSDPWQSLCKETGATWHDKNSKSATRYLGYPMYSNANQRKEYMSVMISKIGRHANILRARGLSIRGASLAANALLLSTLWHVLRVTPLLKLESREIISHIRSLVANFWPYPSWEKLSLPKTNGGLL